MVEGDETSRLSLFSRGGEDKTKRKRGKEARMGRGLA